MQLAQYIVGGALILVTVFLIAIILMQTGKEKGLSGTITGGSDTYFGKAGGSMKEKILFKLTVVGTVIFIALVLAMVMLAYVDAGIAAKLAASAGA